MNRGSNQKGEANRRSIAAIGCFRFTGCTNVHGASKPDPKMASAIPEKGSDGLSGAVQTVLQQGPFGGHVFVFCAGAVISLSC